MSQRQAFVEKHWRALVFFAALAARLAFLAFWNHGNYTEKYGYDPYISIAQYWLGWVAPVSDVTHPPVYTIWVTLLFLVAGKASLLVVQLANIVLASASCVLLGLWAERAVSRPLGRLSGAWAAFDPLLIFFSVQVQSEPFFIFLELLFFLGLQSLGAVPAAVMPVIALGALGGTLTLTRSVFAVYPVFLLPTLIAPDWRRAKSWLWLALLAGWMIPISFWAARNAVKHREFIPLALNGGWNLWEGFTLDREEVRRRPPEMAAELRREGLDPANPKVAGEYFAKKTKNFILAHPGEALKIITGKFFLYWRPWPYDPHQKSIRGVLAAYFSLLFFFALLGLRATRPHWRALAPAFALIVYLSLLHSVFFTSLRYRSPLEPFLCVLAAAGLLSLRRKS